MIYINDQLIVEDTSQSDSSIIVKKYLHKNRLVLVNNDGQPMSDEELNTFLSHLNGVQKLKAVSISNLLRDLKQELQLYIKKVEAYIENIRDNEDFSSVNTGFAQVMEGILEFSVVASFLQKDLIDPSYMQQLSEKAFARAETGEDEYVLDIIEYELLPILNRLYDEINEEM
ncbi:hypothetical protein J2Z40_002557 [Cytobacillus eiseniae]|uniref:Uncharacterized protein n=1 Tax=Cytobacillus eiseniae TaxID=762947 RepID=A0ABS4RGX8_9BACI|nr:hypothetical protein [Cytobacillus eiseniae]MBP2241984.1 hypothetical protein [Cytobacillus eiseniae]